MTEEIKAEKYMNLMMKTAWSFHRTTGLPFDDLLSSTFLAFTHCKKSYDPNKSEFTTYLYKAMKTRILNDCNAAYHGYVKDEDEEQPNAPFKIEAALTMCHQTEHQDPERLFSIKQTLKNMSQEAQQVCETIFNSPQEFLEQGRPKLSRGNLKKYLREQGWSWPKIYNSFREIRDALTQIGH